MKVEIKVEGEERLDRALRGVAADLSDLRPSWRAVSDEVYSIIRQQFASEGGRGSGKWPERSKAYVEQLTAINRRGFAVLNQTLRRTDTMFKALTTRGAPRGIYEEAPDSLTLGTDLPYAGIHQRGGSRIPRRRIYDLTERDAARLMSILKRGLVGKVKDRGFDYVEDFGGVVF